MEFDLESYMELEGLPESERQLLRKQANHSFALYALNGDRLEHPLSKEDLLAVISGMERFMVDSGSRWKEEAAKPENRDKAFVIGDTVLDEEYDLNGNLFGKKVDIFNKNIFVFGALDWHDLPPHLTQHPTPPSCLSIDRYDLHFQMLFDKQKLRLDSRPRAKRTDLVFLEREYTHQANVSNAKRSILAKLGLSNIAGLPAGDDSEHIKCKLIQFARTKAADCLKNFVNSDAVAASCYAALLLEDDDVGDKTRREFNDPNKRNVFGDMLVMRQALWLKSRVLSDDRAVKRMADYIGLDEMKVTGMV